MTTYRTRSGKVFSWTGHGICVCSQCEEIFGSVGAFDAHIKRGRRGGKPVHDYSWMVRNKNGYLVRALWERDDDE